MNLQAHERCTVFTHCALGRASLVLALFLCAFASARADQTVYADGVANGWENWSWASVDLGNTTPTQAGSQSIRVTADGHQALYFHHSSQDSSAFQSVSFWINGGSAGGQRLRVQGTLNAAVQAAMVVFGPLPANTWQQVTVSLAELGVGSSAAFDGFWIQNDSGSALPTFYVDEVRLLSAGPTLRIANASTNEGNIGLTPLAFAVTLTPASSAEVTVQYATAALSAEAGSDYQTTSGQLVFAAGETQKSVSVNVVGDGAEEANETFAVNLSSASGAAIGAGAATGTIVNDDLVLRASVNDVTVLETNAGTAAGSFTISLNVAPTTPVSVEFSTSDNSATGGSDYQPLVQTVAFAVGELQRTVQVQIIGDTVEEPTEAFNVTLTNPSGGLTLGDAAGIGTIFDNDGAQQGKAPTGSYSYAEVLQKSLFFYECQRAGTLPSTNRVTWRGNSATTDGAAVGRDLTGGWFDAGDHVKFGFPMAASATVLAWAGTEYLQAFTETGQLGHLLESQRWVCDYFLKCHVLDASGDTLEFYGQVGNGGADHAFWGAPEVMTMARPAYKVTRTAPGSDLTGETAAALAASAMLFQGSDATYAAMLLSHARKLYAFAETYRGSYSSTITDAAAYYNSWSGYQDELVWGALWLYRATGENSYLQKAIAAYNALNPGSLRWTHAWDDKIYGSVVLLSMLTSNETYRTKAESWLNFWTTGDNGARVTYTPGGLAWLDQGGWGNLRYSMNTAFLAFIYSDRVRDYNGRYRNFAIGQVNYALGTNPLNRSYVCGFGSNPPVNPHHRAAHGSWNNNIANPTLSRHVLYGALVGGPGSNDAYTDDRSDYVKNEVATDYNAGFTGALAKMYLLFGGFTQPGFPTAETPEPQFFVEAAVNQSGTRFTEIRALLNNRSAWPARESTALRFRYFLDLTELYAAGGSAANVALTANGLEGGTLTGLLPWDAARNLYYLEVRYDGVNIVPGGSTSWRREAQFRFTIPNSFPTSAWNPANDFSYQGLAAGGGNFARSVYLPTYESVTLLEGLVPAREAPMEQWQTTYFGSAGNPDAAPLVDFDKDFLPNIIEYAVGGDPKAWTAVPVSFSTASGRLTMTFPHNTAAGVLTLTVEGSDNLAAWAPLARSINGASFTKVDPNVTIAETGSGSLKTVVVTDAYLRNDPLHPRRFMRLNVAK